MRIDDLIIMSVRSLWRRKLRTGLTVLGVIIGACSIILMLSLGVAMNESFKGQMKDMSSLTLIDVHTASYGPDDEGAKLDKKGLEYISSIPGVELVIPERAIQGKLIFGKYQTPWAMRIIGLSEEEFTALGYKVAKGEPFKDGDKTILLGHSITSEFTKNGKQRPWDEVPEPIPFNVGKDRIKIDLGQYDWETGKPATTPQGQAVAIPKKRKVTVGGIFGEQDYNTSYQAYVPLDLFEELYKDYRAYEKKLLGTNNEPEGEYFSAKVKVSSEKVITDVLQTLKDYGYQAYSPLEFLEQMKKTSMMIQLLLGGIGGISMLVAAIGIANTMMMSIYERTKEIGIMKVIGARVSDIKKMFLIEAIMIGASGGFIGVVGSYGASYLLNLAGSRFTGGTEAMAISIIPLWLALTGFGFASLVGLVAGYLPAKRAMQLSALSAIKTD